MYVECTQTIHKTMQRYSKPSIIRHLGYVLYVHCKATLYMQINIHFFDVSYFRRLVLLYVVSATVHCTVHIMTFSVVEPNFSVDSGSSFSNKKE